MPRPVTATLRPNVLLMNYCDFNQLVIISSVAIIQKIYEICIPEHKGSGF